MVRRKGKGSGDGYPGSEEPLCEGGADERPGGHAEARALSWYPAMDVKETETEIVLNVELPGVGADQVELTVSGDVLEVRGEKHQDPRCPRRTYHVMERVFGPFLRRIRLPAFVDPSEVDAEFVDGILSVVLPKVEEGGSRVIQIRED